jgi:hypothetical protein
MAAASPLQILGIWVRFVAPDVGQPATLSVFRSLHAPDRQSFALLETGARLRQRPRSLNAQSADCPHAVSSHCTAGFGSAEPWDVMQTSR